MATRGSQTVEDVFTVGADESAAFRGLKHERIRYTAVANTETADPGSQSIVFAAWEPDDSSDQVSVTVVDVNTVGFAAPAGSHDGHLHVWSRGY